MDEALAIDTTEEAPKEAKPKKKRRYSGSFLAVARGQLGVQVERSAGRPTKLAPKTVQTLLEAISKGSHYIPACTAAGVSAASVSRWIEIGNSHIAEDKRSDYADFVRCLHEAAAIGETKLVSKINDQTDQDWRAGAFLLERRHPDRWGKREQASTQISVVISDQLVRQLTDALQVANAKPLESIDITPVTNNVTLPTANKD